MNRPRPHLLGNTNLNVTPDSKNPKAKPAVPAGLRSGMKDAYKTNARRMAASMGGKSNGENV